MTLTDQFNAWADQLVDLSGKNDLITFRQTSTSTVVLTEEQLKSLMSGTWCPLKDLFDLAEKGTKALLRKVISIAEDNSDQLGIETLNVICGLVEWSAEKISRPSAPFQLFEVEVKGTGTTLERCAFRLIPESNTINPVFIQYLRTRAGLNVSDDAIDEALDSGPEAVQELLIASTPPELALNFQPGAFIKNLSYQKLPMVEDLRRATDALSRHDVIASLAGDQSATERLQAATSSCSRSAPNTTPSREEFLILDADASQHWAINTALDGQNLVIEGPPGTGKSQTIANLIGAFMARGRSVLFVAEKRAAIDAVKKRIDRVGLGELMLDLHDASLLKARPARPFAQALDGLGEIPNVDLEPIHGPLDQAKHGLLAHSDALHRERQPWGCSYYAVGELLVETAAHQAPNLRFSSAELKAINREKLETITALLSELSNLPAAQALRKDWLYGDAVRSGSLRDGRAIQDLLERNDGLDEPIARLNDWCSRIEQVLRDKRDLSLQQATEIASLHHELFGETAQAVDLDALLNLSPEERQQLAGQLNKGLKSGVFGALFDREHRQALKQAAAWSRSGDLGHVQQALRLIEALLKHLHKPVSIDDSHQVVRDLEAISGHLRWLRELGLQACDPLGSLRDAVQLHGATHEHRRLLIQAVPISQRLADLETLGASRQGLRLQLTELLSEGIDIAALQAAVRRSWAKQVEERMVLEDRYLSGGSRGNLDAMAQRFREGDRQAIDANPLKIRRLVAERAHAIRITPQGQQQERLIRGEAIKQRRKGRLTARRLFEAAPELLTALKPCWAMSPLVVSQLLPADRQHFDVVIFDEASQIVPHEAVTAILRGKQVVVAGDSKQLSPTSSSFFSSREEDDDTDASELEDISEYEVDAVKDAESLLEAMKASLPRLTGTRMLQWHYRSEDERLIAFSNAHPDLYARRLITLPGAATQPPFRFHLVQGSQSEVSGASPNAEVARTVDLAIEHLLKRPDQSLAVLAFGLKHATRIQKQFTAVMDSMGGDIPLHPPDRPEEKFRIRNLESIQGDERDVVIIATGYGLTPTGKPSYAFGPLNNDENLQGLRRLNVAITRARKTVEVVTTINPDLYDANRLTKVGSKAFIDYLRYVRSGGDELGDLSIETPPMNPFEQDIFDALSEKGMKLLPQYGVSGYRLDFAVQHPEEPGRYVLAIEADGAAYHSSDTARDRDRIRQEHLERLGWSFHRIWSTEWIHNRSEEIALAVRAYEAALRRSERREPASPPPAPLPTTLIAATTAERKPRPAIPQKATINDYSDAELRELVLWWQSDEILRSDEEIINALVPELGFRRKGTRIVDRLTQAIGACRSAGQIA